MWIKYNLTTFFLSISHLLWAKQCCEQLYRDAHVARSASLLPRGSCQQWMSLAIDFPVPVKSLALQYDSLITTSWETLRTIHLSSSQIPDPQNQCEKIQVSGFKLPNVQVTSYSIIDNYHKYLLKSYNWSTVVCLVSQTYALAIAPFCQVYSSSALHD